MGIPLTEERYAAWYSELWQTTPGANVKEKTDWLFEHSTHSEWAIMRGEYLRVTNGKQPRKIKPLPYNPRKEVPRPISRPYWTPKPLAGYDTGLGMAVASYAPTDDEDDGDDGERADGEDEETARWRRHHRRKEWAA